MTTVDSHHHFWDPGRADYPWMTDDLVAIRRAFGPDDLRPLLAAARIDASIVVQTRSSIEETAELLATAAGEPFVAGVVGWVDLTDPAVPEAISRLRELPGGQRLVGVRHQVHDEDDPAWLGRPDVRRGLAAVGDAGLTYDLLVRTRELPAALEAVRALPDLRFVVDHVAKPEIARGVLEPWAGRLSTLAGLPNTFCKLSGMVTEAVWTDWSVDDLRPYAEVVLETFGPSRLLFGSDWPVCLLAAGYQDVVDVTHALLEDLSVDERGAVFGGTALEVYRLALD